MKKIGFYLLCLLSSKQSISQTDMIASLKAIGDNVSYTEYWEIIPNPGKNTISEKNYEVVIKAVTNKYGQVVGFDGVTKTGEKQIEYNNMHGQFDHYTHPAFFLKKSSNRAYAIINGVIFEFEKFTNVNSFEIDKLWIPKVPKDKSNEPVFQGAKIGDLKSADLIKLVTDYYAAVQKIQEANPYSTKEQEEADEMQFIVDSTNLSYQQSNAAYWNSEEGKKKLAQLRNKKAGDGWVTIKNTGKKELNVITDKGTSSSISAGSTAKWPCSTDIYYCSKDTHNTWNVKGELIVKGKEYCGKEYQVKND